MSKKAKPTVIPAKSAVPKPVVATPFVKTPLPVLPSFKKKVEPAVDDSPFAMAMRDLGKAQASSTAAAPLQTGLTTSLASKNTKKKVKKTVSWRPDEDLVQVRMIPSRSDLSGSADNIEVSWLSACFQSSSVFAQLSQQFCSEFADA